MEDHHISSQSLAAFLDGNAGEDETLRVLRAMRADPRLRSEVQLLASLDLQPHELMRQVLPMSRLAAEDGQGMCSLLCEAYVLRRRDIAYDEQRLVDTARRHRWLTPQGTPLHAIGQLLAHEGLLVARQYDATLTDLARALSCDNDLIVAVDVEKLYPGRPDEEDAPNHAVVVTAVADDCSAVTFIDPACSPEACDVAAETFLSAWAESSCYVVRVLQSAADYEPRPICLDGIELTPELQELREAIAENAHDVWASTRMKEGWTYGPERDDGQRRHPDLIPYSALAENEKNYDRLMAMTTIRLLKKLGFDIVKR